MDPYAVLSLWSYQETIEDLRNKVWAVSCELEDLRNNAGEEIRRREEDIYQLIQLLKAVRQERDEVRNQLQMLLSKLAEPVPFLMSDSPRFRQARGSSSITESEKISDINIFSSPVDSILEAATASELSFLNMDDSCNDLGLRQSNMKISVPPACFHFDPIEERFNRLAKQKPLPEKGRLVEAVIDAGPLLHTLSVGGNLPKWSNPPSLKPSFIPQMPSKTSESQHQRRMLPSLPIT